MSKPGDLENFANERERLSAYDTLIWIDVVGDQERFILDTLKALNLWERIGHPDGSFFGYSGLTVAFDFLGQYALSRRYHHLAMKVAQEQQPLALGYVRQGLTIHYSWLGLPEKALEHGDKASYYHREAGFLRGWGTANFIMAETLIYQGLVEEAESKVNELLVIGREGGDTQLEAWGLLFLGFALRMAGNQEEAIATFRQCDEIARSVPDYASRVQVWAMTGQSNLDMGRLEAALDALREAEHIIQEHNVIGTRFISMFKVALARAYLLAAETEGRSARKDKLSPGEASLPGCPQEHAQIPAVSSRGLPLSGNIRNGWPVGSDRPASGGRRAWRWPPKSTSQSNRP